MEYQDDLKSQVLGEALRRDKMIRDAEVMLGPGCYVTTVIVQQGIRPGPVLRHRVMQLAGNASGRLQVLLVSSIPRLPGGELDIDAISSRMGDVYRFEEPVTDDERLLVEIVNRVLPGQQISMTDSIGDLGGDSIVTVELATILSEHFATDITPYQIFGASSLRELIEIVYRGRC